MNRHTLQAFSRGMLVACSGWLLSGCSAGDSMPTAPVAPAAQVQVATVAGAKVGSSESVSATKLSAALTNGLTTVKVLSWRMPLAQSVTVTGQIGEAGGTLAIPSLGVRLVVPPRAVSKMTNFQIRALAGSSVAFEFEPHGTTFNVPLKFTQFLPFTNYITGMKLQGGYFKSATQCDDKEHKASVDEVLPAIGADGGVTLDLWHFSGYLVSMA